MDTITCKITTYGDVRWKLQSGNNYSYGYHNNNGPATIEHDGAKMWYVNNIIHRLDGPAYESTSGEKYWLVDGVEYSEFEYWIVVQQYSQIYE